MFEAYRTLRVREVADPQPANDEALVRVRLCGICGSDLSLYETGMLAGPERVLGHEILGVIESSGDHPTGMRVVPLPLRPCGRCAWCRRGRARYCVEGVDTGGGFAELVSFPTDNVVAVPDEVDDRTAALAEPLGVAVRAVELAEVSAGDVVYVSGLGSIGLLTAVAATREGARVVGGDPRAERRALAVDLGCEDAFDPTAEDPFWKLFSYDELGARVAIECSGVPSALQLALNVARHDGVVGILGIPFEPAPILPAVAAVKELRTFSISGPEKRHIAHALELLQRRPETARLVTSVVGLDEVDGAMRRLAGREGDDVKVLVDPSR